MKPYAQLAREFSMTWWQYTVINTAIPLAWKTHNLPAPANLFGDLSRIKKPVAFIYNHFVDTGLDVQNEMFNKIKKHWDVDFLQYQKAFKAIYAVTNVTKYRDFQYRLLVNAIYANNRLYYWKKSTLPSLGMVPTPQTNPRTHALFVPKDQNTLVGTAKVYN